MGEFGVGEWVGANMGQKVTVLCPDCGEKNEVLWFPARRMNYRKQGTTGGSGHASTSRSEKVMGKCKCGYKFKPDGLEDME